MNTAIFNGKASMTSLEIAELVGSRHDSVKRAIERIAGRGVIPFPPMVEKPTAGRPATYTFSKVNKVSATASLMSHSAALNSLLAW